MAVKTLFFQTKLIVKQKLSVLNQYLILFLSDSKRVRQINEETIEMFNPATIKKNLSLYDDIALSRR